VGAVTGFLLFNAPHPWRGQRRTFMGDTGSLVLGFVIVWFSIALTQPAGDKVPPVVMLWVVGLVLLDVFTVTVRRIIRRRDPAAPDRAHIHHLLLRRGYSVRESLLILLAGNAILGAVGTAGWWLGLPEFALFMAFLALGLLYLALFLYPGRLMRWTRRRA
jgi:UDP-GlcNAc:undecaprenyl-phosphate GlcNAc-1-phosphate transferase